MPINTDQLDLSQPLSGQDIGGAAAPAIANPVIDPERIKAMGAKFRELTQAAAKPAAQPNLDEPAPKPPSPKAPDPAAKAAKPPADDPAARSKVHPDKATGDQAKPADAPATETVGSELPHDVILSPRSREAFKRLEQARDDFRKKHEAAAKQNEELLGRLKPLEEELTKVKSALPPDVEQLRKSVTELETIKKERDDLLQRVEALNFEHSPRFQNWWKQTTDKHIKIAQRNVPAEHRERIAQLLLEPTSAERDAEIDKILEPLGGTAKRLINGAIEQLEVAKIEKDDALSKGSENYKKLVEREQQEAQKVRQMTSAMREKITSAALAKAESLEAFTPIEGDTEHNNAIPARKDLVKAMVAGELEEDIMVTVPGLAFQAIHYRDHVIPKLKSDLEAANTLIKQLQAASPRPGEGTGEGPAPKRAQVKPGAQGAFLEAFRATQR